MTCKTINGHTFRVGTAYDVIHWNRITGQPSYGTRLVITEIRDRDHGDVMADDGNEGCLAIWAHMLRQNDLQPAGFPLPPTRG